MSSQAALKDIAQPVSLKANRIVSCLIAGLLLFAAIMKAYQGGHNENSLVIAQAGFETILGVWLASGILTRWGSRVALLAFALFATLSLSNLYKGAHSCGCFGPLQIPPVHTFLLDLTVILALIFLQNDFPIWTRSIASTAVLLAGSAGLSIAHGRIPPQPMAPAQISARPAAAVTRPDAIAKSVSATEWLADVGSIQPGKTLDILFPLTSPNGRELHIRGVNVSCGCTSIPHPPEIIPATGSTDVEVIVRPANSVGPFESQALLTTDSPQLPPLTLRIKVAVQ